MHIEVELIMSCINKEQKAEYELYERTFRYLMSICLRYTSSKEEAREMLNIGFLRILNNLSKFQLETSFKAWIQKVMVNVLIDEYRKEKKHHERIEYVENYDSLEEEYSEMNYVLLKMDVEEINALIVKLPPVSQKVFNLNVIDGFTHKEISRLLGISEGASRWHLSFSKSQLQEMILKTLSTVKIE